MESHKFQFSEFELIGKLTRSNRKPPSDLLVGVGDDCAVIEGSGKHDWLVTTDALMEGTHFRRDWIDPKKLGRKSLAVNLSDIAAMGGAPRFFVVALGLPADMSSSHAEELYSGMRGVAREFDVTMIGGDTFLSSGGLTITITVIGEVKKGKAICRSGSRRGDDILVTGELGGAALGLICLEREMCGGKFDAFIKRHDDPHPRIEIGKWFSKCGIVHSMIDISDGLVADLGHIADESKVGFEIEAWKVPVPSGFGGCVSALELDARELALTGGEDYELLFTVDSKKSDDLLAGAGEIFPDIQITKIGRMVGDVARRFVLNESGKKMSLRHVGFDHFGG